MNMAEHSPSARPYVFTWLALLVLTLLTAGVAFLDLGVFNTVAAVVIAGLKAALIVVLFMHLGQEPALSKVTAAGAVVWLVILVLLTMSDYATRGWVPVPGK